MLTRCYSEKRREINYLSYENCTVCEEWHNYQNFKKWYELNYYEIEEEEMELDKDILYKNNKIYSPQTCIFVPYSINLLFIKPNKRKLPQGVCYDKNRNKYIAQIICINKNLNKGHISLGRYNTVEEAFFVYKNAKEDYVKQLAEIYKVKYSIPDALYNAMLCYKVV
jgi:hypothetical protein